MYGTRRGYRREGNPEMRRRDWALSIKDSSGLEREIVIEQDDLTIGRDPACTIQVESLFVSREHARIRLRDNVTVFTDLGSHNGSLLNGVRIHGDSPLSN